MQRWSGYEARLLREAMRMTVRAFAERLGVSERTVSKWEAGGHDIIPTPESQAMLDTALQLASDDVRQRFLVSFTSSQASLRKRLAAAGSLVVDSHKFIPIFIGFDASGRLFGNVRFDHARIGWLECRTTPIAHMDGECRLYLFECGVALIHLRQRRVTRNLTDLATWRYRSYATDLSWAQQVLSDKIESALTRTGAADYVLSLYWVEEFPWPDSCLDTAVRLVCAPSVLVDRRAAEGPRPLDLKVEESLISEGFNHPDMASFGVQGVSVGYAAWSGVAYYALAPERALTIRELVDLEIIVQMLWCYSDRVQRTVEDGHDPSVPPAYGWRFLRAAHSRLTAARPQETTQHCLMREAITYTSGILGKLRTAQEALRESELIRREVSR